MDFVRRAYAELSAFLDAEAPGCGHDPTVLSDEHAHRFVPDLRNRERLCLAFRGQARLDCKKSKVTENMRRVVFNHGRAGHTSGGLLCRQSHNDALRGSDRRATPDAGSGTDTAGLTYLCEAVRGIGTTLDLKHQAGQLAVPVFADFASVHLCDRVVASEDDLAPQGPEGAVVMHRVAAVHHEDSDCREELRPGKTFVYTTGTAMTRFRRIFTPRLTAHISTPATTRPRNELRFVCSSWAPSTRLSERPAVPNDLRE
ncbi:hypothetical protein [Streptomyces mirabilis]|uniref:Uncharacterized protein n=1 Tax=Streptomyces mirabilis TaxID=68239 RepID=A0A1I2VYU7_9ACTN|nr:hypothetical protein [Streptomyces mirabilis]SFG94375.1 hypothetical protein SAMN02787118_13439 [Streptomyces mirabilis]